MLHAGPPTSKLTTSARENELDERMSELGCHPGLTLRQRAPNHDCKLDGKDVRIRGNQLQCRLAGWRDMEVAMYKVLFAVSSNSHTTIPSHILSHYQRALLRPLPRHSHLHSQSHPHLLFPSIISTMRVIHLCNMIIFAIAVRHVGAAPTSNALGSPTPPQNGSLDARSWSWGSRSSRPPPDFQVKERDARSASYEHLPSWTQAQSISALQLNKRTLVQRNDRPLRRDEDSSDDTDIMRTGSSSSSSYEPEPPHGPEANPPHDRMQDSEPDGPLSQRGDDANPADELDDPSYSADVTSDTSGPQPEPEPESSLSRRDDDGEDTSPADELDGDGSSPADASSDASSDTSDAPVTNVQAMSAPADQSGSDAAATSGTNSTSDSGDTQPAAPGADANADDADGSTSASSDGVQAASASSTTPTDSSGSIADSSNSDAGSESAAPDSESSEGATDANADDSSPSDGTIAGSELLRCRNVGRDALCED
jgi:hypothetical protein